MNVAMFGKGADDKPHSLAGVQSKPGCSSEYESRVMAILVCHSALRQ